MVYVNSEGKLYTCGMVDGDAEYHLGDAMCDSMKRVVQDPKRPVAVPLEHARKVNGCDGCPPIVVRRFG
jgi:radical SAM protein with 4Fe4S-binding SPASM domain